jgi:hypothetical protein
MSVVTIAPGLRLAKEYSGVIVEFANPVSSKAIYI